MSDRDLLRAYLRAAFPLCAVVPVMLPTLTILARGAVFVADAVGVLGLATTSFVALLVVLIGQRRIVADAKIRCVLARRSRSPNNRTKPRSPAVALSCPQARFFWGLGIAVESRAYKTRVRDLTLFCDSETAIFQLVTSLHIAFFLLSECGVRTPFGVPFATNFMLVKEVRPFLR